MKVFKNRLSLKAAAGIAVTFGTLFFGVASANAVSFVLKDGSNKAINVWLGSNAQYKFDGTQRAFVLQYNPNDREQRFDELPGNRGGKLYRVEGTNLCLNNHYNRNGAPINVWNCDGNDPDQNWRQINLAGSIHLQNVTSGRCADSLFRDVAPNNLYVWDCIAGNRNQQFNVIGGATPAPAPAPAPSVNRDTPFLPFDPGVTLPVTQGYAGSYPGGSHSDNSKGYLRYNRYAVDFGAGGRNVGARAVRYGQVVYAGWKDGGYGNVVVVRYTDGKYGRYMHLNQIWNVIKPGYWVAGGQGLGQIGQTGNATGPHLHYAESSTDFGDCIPLPQFADAPNANFNTYNFSLTSQNPDGRR